MSEESIPRELLASLERTAERFPGQPAWRSLAAKAREAVAGPEGAQADGGRPSDDEAPQRSTCWCCDRRPSSGEHGLCDLCRELYEPRSARVVGDLCDCGHPPEGRQVYIYTPGRTGHVLCGRDCVCAHWRGLFGFFLRRSS